LAEEIGIVMVMVVFMVGIVALCAVMV
jgi:hypothetical protein